MFNFEGDAMGFRKLDTSFRYDKTNYGVMK